MPYESHCVAYSKTHTHIMFISLDLNDGKDADETESVGMLDSTRSTSSNSSSSPHPADHRHQPTKGPKSHHTAAIHRTLAEAGAFSSYVNVCLSKLNSQRLKETVDHLMHSSRGGKGGGTKSTAGSPVAQLINRLVSSTNSFSLYSEMILAYHPPPLSNAASSRTAWREPPLGEGGYISLYRLPKVDTSGPSPVFASPCQPHDEVFRRSLTSLRDVKAQDVGRQGMVVFRYLPPGKPTSWNDSSSAPAAVRFTTRRSRAASMVSASSTASLDESLNEFPTSALGNDGEERSGEATAPSSPTSAGGGGRRSGALLRRFSVYRPPLSCFGSIGMSLSFDPTRITDPDVETGYGGVDGTQRDKQAYNHLDIRFASGEDREVWVRLLKQLVGAAALEDLRNEGVVGGGTGESGGNVRAQVDALLSTAPNIDEYVEYFSSKVVDMVSVSAEGKVTVVDPKKPPANGVLNILFRNGTFKKKRKLWLNEESTLLYIGPESLRQRIRGVPIAELPLRTLSISAQSDEWGNTFFLNQHAEDAAEGSAPYRKLEFSCTSFVERIPWLLWFQKILGKPAEFEESIKRLAQDAAAMQAELEEQEGAVDCHTSFSLPKAHRNMLGHEVQNASFRLATPNRSNNIAGRGMQSESGGPAVRNSSGLPLASREGLLPPLRPLLGSAAEGGGGALTASPSIAFTSSRYFDSEGGSDLDPDEEECLANDDMGNDELLHEGEAHQHEVPNNKEEEEEDDTDTYEFVGRPEGDEPPLIPLAAQFSWSAVEHRHEAAAKDVPLPPPTPSQANHPNRAETTVLDPVENWPMMEVSSNPLGDPTTPATPPRGGDDNIQRRQRDISEGEEEEAQTPDSGLRRTTSDHHSSATARLSSTDDNVADGSHFTMSTTTEPNTSTTSPASAAAAVTAAGLQLRRNGSWSAIIQSLKNSGGSGGSGGFVAANGAPPALTDNNNNNDDDDDDVLSNLSVSFASRSVMLRLADLEEQLAKSTSQANSKTVLTQESDPLPIQPPPPPPPLDASIGTGMPQSAVLTSAPPPPPPSAAPVTIAPSSSSSLPRSIRPTAAPPLVFEDAHMTWCGWVLLFDPIDEQWQKIRLAIMDSPHAPFNPLRIGQVPVLRQLAESWGCGCSESSWILCTSHLRRVRAVQRSVYRSDPLFFASTAARTGASPHPSDGSLFTPPQRSSGTRRTSAFSSSSDHLETTVVVVELHFDLDQWADEGISLLEHRLDRDMAAGGSLDYQVPRALAGSIQLHEPLQLVVLSGLSSKSLAIHDEGTLKLCKEVLPFL